LTSVGVRYPWSDLNGDRTVQANEVFPSGGDFANYQNLTGNWDPKNPASPTTANKIDSNLKNDTTDEFIVGASREIGRGFAVDANYIYRKYGNFTSTFNNGITSADYISTQYTPVCTQPGARCETVTAWYPSFLPSAVTTQLNTPNFSRTFNGFELSGRKRMANHWMMNTSFAYNSIIQNYGAGSFQNPNNIDKRNGFQYDYATAGSGIGNVFVNAKWLYKVSGMYQLPYAVNVSAFYNTRQGYPFEAAIVLTNPIVLTATGQTVTTLPTAAARRRSSSIRSARTGCRPSRTWTSTWSVRSRSGRCTSCRRWTSST
jgi:hypothetical protein